jgi:hypothetical protein
VFVVVGVWTPSVFAFGYVGRPTAELNKGQWSAGFNYSYSTLDLDTTKVENSEVGYDEGPYSWTDWYKVDIEDFTTQRYYGRVAYGISDCWTIYGQLGGADVKAHFDEVDDSDNWSINFDNDFAWGWGTKFTFSKQPKTNWGVALQMNWLDTSADYKDTYEDSDYYESWKEESNLETWDLLIAVGPTIDMGGWRLYGGPFYYYLSGDLSYKETGEWEELVDGLDSGYWTYKESADLRAKDNFGGYIGAEIDVSKNCNAGIEFSATGSGWGAGAGLTFLCK